MPDGSEESASHNVYPAKRRNISPRKIVPETVSSDPNYVYLTRKQLDILQCQEAEMHQFEVDNGLCWRQLYSADFIPETNNVYGNNLEQFIPELQWTGIQKCQFFELLGRRTAANLPEIARIIGKSVTECQRYLELLQTHSAQKLVIDRVEIPAAEEVPPQLIEKEVQAIASDDDELRALLHRHITDARKTLGHSNNIYAFSPAELVNIATLPVEPSVLPFLQAILKEVLKSWMTLLLRMVPIKRFYKLRAREVHSLMRENANLFVGYPQIMDVLEAMCAIKESNHENPDGISKTQESQHFQQAIDVFDASDVENSTAPTHEVEIPDSDPLILEWSHKHQEKDNLEIEHETSSDENEDLINLVDEGKEEYELCAEEEEWLNAVDAYNSELCLHARGLIRNTSVLPPEPRSLRLEKFMQS